VAVSDWKGTLLSLGRGSVGEDGRSLRADLLPPVVEDTGHHDGRVLGVERGEGVGVVVGPGGVEAVEGGADVRAAGGVERLRRCGTTPEVWND